MQWSIFTFDITMPFIHSLLDPNAELICVWPPEEYFPLRDILCIQNAVYGLRTSPINCAFVVRSTATIGSQTT